MYRFFFACLLLGQVFFRLLQGKTYYRKVLEHLVKTGPESLVPVLLVSGFAGAIFTVQTARELVKLDAISLVGSAFTVGFCRELEPILVACIVTGQVGSAFAAEIGAMQVTEQIDALYMMRTNPIDFLVLPRVLACSIMLPILTFIGLAIGLLGGIIAAAIVYQLSPPIFLDSIHQSLLISDLFGIWIKGIFFGVIIAVTSCSWGITTKGGAKEVGDSAKSAVVNSWISIFALDFILSLLLFGELVAIE
jgi:phospholipid/cholesterol/gamma-HCH transport system permease protein